MPKLVEDAAEVEQWVAEKQQLEVMLSWELLEVFNKTKELIQPLRFLAGKAITEMYALASVDSKAKKAVETAMKKEQDGMRLLSRELKPTGVALKYQQTTKVEMHLEPTIKGIDGLKALLDNSDYETFEAQECSDVIRLYGTFIEEAKNETKGMHSMLADLYKQLDDQREGVKIGGKDVVWNKDAKKGYGRLRDMLSGQVAYKVALLEPGPINTQAFLRSMGGGMKVWQQTDKSSMHKIDMYFGLVPASDISGTTTDTIFFFEHFFACEFDAIFYTLPLATIVAGGHHSMIEVATPLSQSGHLDYRIGFYDTLMPKKRTKHPGAVAIDKVLQKAMKSTKPQNRHMLVFYSAPKKVAGCYLFDAKDTSWLSFVDCTKVLDWAKGAKEWPTKKEVYKVILDNKLA